MTDRAKKISELLATTTVANTDKLIVLKDPSGTPSTRSITVNSFAAGIKNLVNGINVKPRYYEYISSEQAFNTTPLTDEFPDLNTDDQSYMIELPFNVTFLGQSYSVVYLDSNSYLKFGTDSDSEYYPLGPQRTGVPSIVVGGGDRMITAYYFGTVDDYFIIRYEGIERNYGADGRYPSRIWEIWFESTNPGVIKLIVEPGSNPTGGVYGIHDGSKWIDVYDPLPRSNQNTNNRENAIFIFSEESNVVHDLKFVGSGVETYVDSNTAFVEINPMQGIINLNDNDGDAEISSAYYGLRLKSTNEGAITLDSAGEINIDAADGHPDAPGNGQDIYINAGHGYGNSSSNNHSGGDIYLRAGLGTGKSGNGSIFISSDENNQWKITSQEIRNSTGGTFSSNSSATTIGVNSADSKSWFARFGDLGINGTGEGASSLIHDADGNLYVLGSANDDVVKTVIVKYDPNGNVLWKRWYANSTDDTLPHSGIGLRLSSDGNSVYVISSSYNNGFFYLLQVSCYDGTMLMNRTIELGGTGWPRSASIYDIAIDGDNNIYLGGEISVYNSDLDEWFFKGWLVKINPTLDSGNPGVVWSKNIDWPNSPGGSAYVNQIVCVGTDIFILTGRGVAKIDSSANIVWQYHLGDSETYNIWANAMIYSGYNNKLIVSASLDNYDCIIQLDPDTGSKGNEVQFGLTDLDNNAADTHSNIEPICITNENINDSGNIYVLFGLYEYSTQENRYGYDSLIIVKYNSALQIQWQSQFSCKKGDSRQWWDGHHGISCSPNGYVAICGYSRPSPFPVQDNSWDMLVLQVPGDGSLTGRYDEFAYTETYFSEDVGYGAAFIESTYTLIPETVTTFGSNIITADLGSPNILTNFRTSLVLKELNLESTGKVRLPVNGDIIDHDGQSPLRDVPQIEVETNRSYYLQGTDRGKHIYFPNGGTVYTSDNSDFKPGTTVVIVSGTSPVGILPNSGNIRSNGTGNMNEDYWIDVWTMATLFYVGNGDWILSAPTLNTGW